MNNSWYQSLMVAQGDGNAITNTTSATSLLTGNAAHAKCKLPAGFFEKIGQKIKIIASGRVSTLVTGPGTLSIDVRLGGTAVFAGGAMSLNTVAQTNTHWQYEAELVLRVVGASAQFFPGPSFWRSHAVIASPAPTAGGAGTHLLPYNTAAALGTAFDATTEQIVDLFATWGTASASNSIQLHNFELLSCN